MNNVTVVPSIPYLGVTKDGRVMNMISGKWLSICDNGHGYKQVFVSVKNKRYVRYVHRLVAECYIPNPNCLPEVNHLDGNKANNNADNLEWCTRGDNARHAYRTGLMPPMSDERRRLIGEIGKTSIIKAREGWKEWAKTNEARKCWIKNIEKADRWGTRNEPTEVKAARRREKKRLYRLEHSEEISKKAHDRYMMLTDEQRAERNKKSRQRYAKIKENRQLKSAESTA